MTIGEKLLAARQQAGLTQAQLAEKSGVAVISIHQYEAGKRNPRIDQLAKLADALGCSISSLLGDGNEELSKELQHRYYRTFCERVSNELAGCDPEDIYAATGSYDPYEDIFEGRVPLTIDVVNSVAEELGVSVDYLLGLDDPLLGSELEEIVEIESNRLKIPKQVLREALMNRTSDGAAIPLNYQTVAFFFDSYFQTDNSPEKRLLSLFGSLNMKGQMRAISFLEDITKIADYRKE